MCYLWVLRQPLVRRLQQWCNNFKLAKLSSHNNDNVGKRKEEWSGMGAHTVNVASVVRAVTLLLLCNLDIFTPLGGG
jgi:hypothetical protein